METNGKRNSWKKNMKNLGLTVTTDELFDLVQGPNPHPLIKQYFADPATGQYNRNLIR